MTQRVEDEQVRKAVRECQQRLDRLDNIETLLEQILERLDKLLRIFEDANGRKRSSL